MKLQRRASFGWGPTAAGSAPCKNGVVVHYDGSDQGLAKKTHEACRAYWKRTRVFHMTDPGHRWRDIGYSYACCPHGIVMEGRGFGREQAAQPGGNTTWTSVTFMSGDHEKPTPAQVEAFRELRAWLRGKGLAAAISYHGRFISTSCPGSALRQMVTSGALAGAPSKEEDDMLSAQEIADAVKNVGYNGRGDKAGQSWQAAKDGMDDIRPRIHRIEAEQAAQGAKLDAILAALAPKEG